MLPYQNVLFDLDGTLTESGLGIMSAVRFAMRQMDVAIDEARLHEFIGPPLYESFRDIAGLSDADAKKAVDTYRIYYSERGWAENKVYTGIPKILATLKENGCKLYVATGKPLLFTEKILKKFHLYQYFDGISAITLTDEHADKAKLIKNAIGEGCANACMVGDRIFDVQGAREDGIDSIGVLYGYGSEAELLESGATYIAKDTASLYRLLLGDTPCARGKFISLEGCDGCGKTTQRTAIAETYRQCGWEVVLTREPGGCKIAENIRSLLLSNDNRDMNGVCEALLFAAARAQHVREVIAPAVESGKIVLSDRFVDSSVAYQGYARGLGVEKVEAINAPAVGNCLPDKTLFFDLAPDVAMHRRAAVSQLDRIESEKMDFAQKVYRGYCALAEMHPERIVKIDASGSVAEVFARCEKALF